MFGYVSLGQYVPGVSPLHRLDARTKLLATLAFLMLLLAGRGPGTLIACALFSGACLVIGRLPVRALWRGFRPILLLLVITVVLGVLLTPGGGTLWHAGPLVISRQGAHQAVSAGVRLGLLVLQSSVLTVSTEPLQLSAAAERLLRPFRRFGVPAHELALMSSIALRFIPTLAEEAQRIRLAQAARGGDVEARGRARLRALIALLVPLLIAVFRRADDLALAMEARGYRGEQGRTHWHQTSYGRQDLGAAAAMCLLAAAVVGSSVGWRL